MNITYSKPIDSWYQTGTTTLSGKNESLTMTTGRNIFIDMFGHICKLPFDAGRNGIWKYDGQFYYLTNHGKGIA